MDLGSHSWDLELNFSTTGTLLIQISGSWKLQNHLPSSIKVFNQIKPENFIQRIAFDSKKLANWDTGLLTFISSLNGQCLNQGIVMDLQGLPAGVRRLLKLASAVPESKEASKTPQTASFFTRVGLALIQFLRASKETLEFIGEAFLTFLKFFTGKARYRMSDLILTIQECGAQALPIVSLISLLVGLILAFVGAVQLKQFGAQIYVANLVGLGMVREMGTMMTAVIMAGRTGAAFAAQLGTMQVNQEIDALKTLGISPMEFLVLPRMIALMLMMPLLCLYSDLLGILGGALVSWGMLDISLIQYFNQTQGAIGINDFLVGLIKSVIFGVIVAISGCLRGMQCGNSSSAVGNSATSAVVTAIVLVIVWDAIFAIIFNIVDF